jgi:hypothetical protein
VSTVSVVVNFEGAVGLLLASVGGRVGEDVMSIVVSDDGRVDGSLLSSMIVVGGVAGEMVRSNVLSVIAVATHGRLMYELALRLVRVGFRLCVDCSVGVMINAVSS